MAFEAFADLTIKEVAHLAGVPKRRIEKDCEEGIVPRRKMRLLMHGTQTRETQYKVVLTELDIDSTDEV